MPWQHRSIDTVHQEHTQVTVHNVFCLNEETGEIKVVGAHRTQETITSSESQIYDPALDRVFPVRKPGNPSEVHDDYAHDQNARRCHPKVRVESATITNKDFSDLWTWVEFANPARVATGAHQEALKWQIRDRLETSCVDELRCMVEGKAPPSQDFLECIRVEERHCISAAEKRQLPGQRGVTLSPAGRAYPPTVDRGRLLCLFAGSKVNNLRDEQAYLDAFGPDAGANIHNYAAKTKKTGRRKKGDRRNVMYVSVGGGNIGQYANTTVAPSDKDSSTLVIDPYRVNASLFRVTFRLFNKHGRPATEDIIALALHRPLGPDEQIRLNYGPKYTLENKLPALSNPTPARPLKREAPDSGESGRRPRGGSVGLTDTSYGTRPSSPRSRR